MISIAGLSQFNYGITRSSEATTNSIIEFVFFFNNTL